MTSAVARVDFQWLSFLLSSSHSTSPSVRGSPGITSISVRSAQAWVSMVSLYQSHERSSGAQKVPWSGSVLAESITDEKTSLASAGRPMRWRVSASIALSSGECCFQWRKLKSRTVLHSPSVSAEPIHDGSGYDEAT